MIVALMLPNLTQIGIIIDFKINQDYIAKVLCIKRDKPITSCNGKCYLSEKLKRAEEKEEKQLPRTANDKVEIVYCYREVLLNISNTTYFSEKLSLNKFENDPYSCSFIKDIFHPPQFNLI